MIQDLKSRSDKTRES